MVQEHNSTPLLRQSPRSCVAWPKAHDWSMRCGRLINRQSNGNEHSTTPQPYFASMSSSYNTNNNNTRSALDEIEAWRAAPWAQWEREDQEMEQMVQEAQLRAEEEWRREELRRIGEQKWIVEEAEWQRRVAELQRVAWELQVVREDDDDDGDKEEDRWGAGPSAPKKRKYNDKVSNNRKIDRKQKKLTT